MVKDMIDIIINSDIKQINAKIWPRGNYEHHNSACDANINKKVKRVGTY